MKKEQVKIDLFFPYYINRGRLLDIYAIINGGYSEYEEIETSDLTEKKEESKSGISASVGFKLLKIGGDLAGMTSKTGIGSSDVKIRKVQTVTSILSIVKTKLFENGLIASISDANEGDFVDLSVIFQYNSVKKMIEELGELIRLCKNMEKISAQGKGTDVNILEFENLSKSMKSLFAGEEVVYESDYFAIVGRVNFENLYQSVKEDLIHTKLRCLGQIKRIYPEGGPLMRDTIFTKIKDKALKKSVIDGIAAFNKNDIFDFDYSVISGIEGKKLYEIEIIALYK